ncbi:MAG: HAMP domain-containing histidine kinase [Candidatus Kapabacteria bacterium]|nr:HAMP domain-containing histidine kinase [Candidatus Kapabacteria bacterium]
MSFLLLGGCGVWGTLPGELRFEGEGTGNGSAMVALVRDGDTVWTTVATAGSAAWGIPYQTRLTFLGAAREGIVREIPGRCRAVLSDSVVWVLIENDQRWEWVGVDLWGREWARRTALSGPTGEGLKGLVVGPERWIFANQEEIWSYEPGRDQWSRVAEQVVSSAWDPGQRLVAWIRREGARGELYWTGDNGRVLWLAAVEQPDSVRLWVLPGGRIALAEQRSERETRVRVWRAQGSLEYEERCPAPAQRVAVLWDTPMVVPLWLERRGSEWEVRRAGIGKPVATLAADGDASLYSVHGRWLAVTEERLTVGDVQGIHARADVGGGAIHLVASLGGDTFLIAVGQRLQLWRLRSVSLLRRLLVWLGQGLSVLGMVFLLGVGGRWVWQTLLHRALLRFLQGGPLAGSSYLVDLRRGSGESIPSPERAGRAATEQSAGGQEEGMSSAEHIHQQNPGPKLQRSEQQWRLLIPLPPRWEWQIDVTPAVEEQQIQLAGLLSHELFSELDHIEGALKREDKSRMVQVVRRLKLRIESARSLARATPVVGRVAVEDLWAKLSEEYEDLINEGILQLIRPALPLYLQGDLQWVFRALANAVENAWQAVWRTDGARIVVQASRQQYGWVLLEVSDNGMGMPGKVKPGLGMLIIRDVVNAHGGRVKWVPNPGGGTCVRMWFVRA